MIQITIRFKYKLDSRIEFRKFSISDIVIATDNRSITFIIFNEQTKEGLYFKANVWRPFKVFSIKSVVKLFEDIHCYFYHSLNSYTSFDNIVEVRKRRGEKILQTIKL